jgi:hypothetical protein
MNLDPRWEPVPFSAWLYARLCAHNETQVGIVLAQMIALVSFMSSIPVPKTWVQRQLFKYITWIFTRRMLMLGRLVEKGLVAQGFITFTKEDNSGISTTETEVADQIS